MVTSDQRGYTLVETLTVVAIVATLFTLGPDLVKQTERFFMLNRTQTELQQDTRISMALIAANLREGVKSSIVIDNAPGQPYCSRIRFAKMDGTAIQFYQNNTQLVMNATPPGGVTVTRILTSSLRSLAFGFTRSYDLSSVTMTLGLQKGIYEGKLKNFHMATEQVNIWN